MVFPRTPFAGKGLPSTAASAVGIDGQGVLWGESPG